jgi:hypothetical protein
LHADGQVIIVVLQAPAASHAAADVLTPFMHDCPAPHAVPTCRLPVVMQTGSPVAHEVIPSLHGSVGVQTPSVHGTQLPALQTWFIPQLAPLPTDVPVSWQVWLPVVQTCIPVWQGLVGVHMPPFAQATHAPPLQTMFMFVPHGVPGATFPVSAQTGTPVTHEFAPVLHGFVGWQVEPGLHIPHVPLLQTMSMPHDAPLTRLRPVSEQVIVGEHVCVPAWHRFVGVHDMPALHETQLPELQTWLFPQLLPLATFPDSAQTAAPVLHVVVPVRQGLPLTGQLAPSWQSMQAPAALQTLFMPQPFPAATSVPVSLQTGVPVAHASVPVWQGLVGMQGAACWQALHWPVRQTIPVPHDAPLGLSAFSVQTATPVAQTFVPVRHRLVGVQVLPPLQVTQLPALLHTMFGAHMVPVPWNLPVSMHDITLLAEQTVCPT